MSLISKPLTFAVCRKLAEKRLKEAKLLLENKEYSGAYYLSGYVVEIALKGCYCKKVGRYNFPPEKNIYNKLYTHNLNDILSVSGIKREYENEVISNQQLQISWEVAKDWSEKTRYQIIKKEDAKSMVESVETIFNWIKTIW